MLYEVITDVDRVAVFRKLGYGYCLLAYNNRNWVGDGCFETENAGLTGMGKLLVDAYNRYGMILDVSHCGEKLSLDVIERSKDPVISSHSVAYSVAPYPRSISDARIVITSYSIHYTKLYEFDRSRNPATMLMPHTPPLAAMALIRASEMLRG